MRIQLGKYYFLVFLWQGFALGLVLDPHGWGEDPRALVLFQEKVEVMTLEKMVGVAIYLTCPNLTKLVVIWTGKGWVVPASLEVQNPT